MGGLDGADQADQSLALAGPGAGRGDRLTIGVEVIEKKAPIPLFPEGRQDMTEEILPAGPARLVQDRRAPRPVLAENAAWRDLGVLARGGLAYAGLGKRGSIHFIEAARREVRVRLDHDPVKGLERMARGMGTIVERDGDEMGL